MSLFSLLTECVENVWLPSTKNRTWVVFLGSIAIEAIGAAWKRAMETQSDGDCDDKTYLNG